MRGTVVSVSELSELRRMALRRRVWFKVLDGVERAIVSLTIRCVNTIRSPKLVRIVMTIVNKLEEAMRSRVGRLMETVGRQVAQKLSRLALSWGNWSADFWAWDPDFIQYLAIMHMNMPKMFQLSSSV